MKPLDIPKRLDIRQPGLTHWNYSRLEVRLNGVKQEYCVAYDQKLGYVERYKADPKTKQLVMCNHEPIVERMVGCVSLKWIDD